MPINAYIAIVLNLQTAQKLSENCVEHCTFVDYKSMCVSVLCQTELSIIHHINKVSCISKCNTAGLPRRWFTNVKTT